MRQKLIEIQFKKKKTKNDLNNANYNNIIGAVFLTF